MKWKIHEDIGNDSTLIEQHVNNRFNKQKRNTPSKYLNINSKTVNGVLPVIGTMCWSTRKQYAYVNSTKGTNLYCKHTRTNTLKNTAGILHGTPGAVQD